MVKYVAVADDIIYANTGRKVNATHISIPLTFDDMSVELDLADETYDQLRELLMPVFSAYAAANPGASLAISNNIKELSSGVTREMRRTDKNKYNAACRAWARSTGRGDQIKHSSYCPASLCDEFDNYLALRHGGLAEL